MKCKQTRQSIALCLDYGVTQIYLAMEAFSLPSIAYIVLHSLTNRQDVIVIMFDSGYRGPFDNIMKILLKITKQGVYRD